MLILALILPPVLACQAAPTRTAAPSPIALQRLPAPAARLTPTPMPSGGLGLFRDEFEARFGANGRPNGRFITYRSGQITVALANDLVWYIEREWIPEEIPRRADARTQSRDLIPGDAILLGNYETRGAMRFERFRSAGLAERFQSAARIADPFDPWPGMEPGTFIVAYRERGDWVSGMLVMTGNVPP